MLAVYYFIDGNQEDLIAVEVRSDSAEDFFETIEKEELPWISTTVFFIENNKVINAIYFNRRK